MLALSVSISVGERVRCYDPPSHVPLELIDKGVFVLRDWSHNATTPQPDPLRQPTQEVVAKLRALAKLVLADSIGAGADLAEAVREPNQRLRYCLRGELACFTEVLASEGGGAVVAAGFAHQDSSRYLGRHVDLMVR